jgi:hypothetical protein
VLVLAAPLAAEAGEARTREQAVKVAPWVVEEPDWASVVAEKLEAAGKEPANTCVVAKREDEKPTWRGWLAVDPPAAPLVDDDDTDTVGVFGRRGAIETKGASGVNLPIHGNDFDASEGAR